MGHDRPSVKQKAYRTRSCKLCWQDEGLDIQASLPIVRRKPQLPGNGFLYDYAESGTLRNITGDRVQAHGVQYRVQVANATWADDARRTVSRGTAYREHT